MQITAIGPGSAVPVGASGQMHRANRPDTSPLLIRDRSQDIVSLCRSHPQRTSRPPTNRCQSTSRRGGRLVMPERRTQPPCPAQARFLLASPPRHFYRSVKPSRRQRPDISSRSIPGLHKRSVPWLRRDLWFVGVSFVGWRHDLNTVFVEDIDYVAMQVGQDARKTRSAGCECVDLIVDREVRQTRPENERRR